jgi:hypothetical protein
MPIRTERSARREPAPASHPVGAPSRRPEHPGSPFTRPAPRRPDPSAARLALAAGGIATLSALVAVIAGSAVPASTVATTQPANTVASTSNGATVPYGYIQSGQAAPAVVATQLAPSVPVQASVVTRQSGARP